MALVTRAAVSGASRVFVGKIVGQRIVRHRAIKTTADRSKGDSAFKDPDVISAMGWVTCLEIAGLRNRAMRPPRLVTDEMKAARVLTQPRVMTNVLRYSDLLG